MASGGFPAEYVNSRNPYSMNEHGYPVDPSLSAPSGGMTGVGGMNEMSALAAAASDQLHELERQHELERHEALRRAEWEMRHRNNMMGAQGNQGPSQGMGNIMGGGPRSGDSTPVNAAAAAAAVYGFSSERERMGNNAGINNHGQPFTGPPAVPGQTNVFYPVSAAQPETNLHPAVPPGTLADPTYLLPPNCHHEECHKSYRKRLKFAKQTAACPNCLTLAPPSTGSAQTGNTAAASGGSGSNTSSQTNTPQHRSHEDLHMLGTSSGNNSNSGFHMNFGAGGASGANNGAQQQQQAIQQHLQRLAANQAQQRHNQQKLLAQLKSQANAHAFSLSTSAPQSSRKPNNVNFAAHSNGSRAPPSAASANFGLPPGMNAGKMRSNPPSTQVSPRSDSSDDFEDDHAQAPSLQFEMTPSTSPVLGPLKSMSLLQHNAGAPHLDLHAGPASKRHHERLHGHHYLSHLHHGSFTAPGSIHASPAVSRGPSRPGSPDFHHAEGHVAGSGKHGGHTSHLARDAKYRSHPYGGGSFSHSSHASTPNTPALNANFGHKSSGRMSPPRLIRSNSGSHLVSMPRAYEPQQQQQRHTVEDILNAAAGANAPTRPADRPGAPVYNSYAIAQSAPTSAQTSPLHSRSNSPGVATSGGNMPQGTSLAHGVRAAFGMTPIVDHTGRERTLSPPRQQKYDPGFTSPGSRLPPLGAQQAAGYLPSLSRSGSPAPTASAGSTTGNGASIAQGAEASMEVDAQP